MTNKAFLSIAKQAGIFSDYIIDNRVSWFNLKQQARLIKEVTGGNFEYIFDFQCVSRTEKKYFPLFRWFMPHSFTWVSARKSFAWKVEKSRRYCSGKLEKVDYPFTLPVTDLSFLHGENKHFSELPQRFVMLIPGCSPNHPHKRWPIANYCELSRRLAEKGIHSVVIGTKAEETEISTIAAATPLGCSMLNKTSLLDIPDLARRAMATVGNDTGPSHMASLSGAPAIAIYDKRTAVGALRGPRSINMVSPSTIDLITVDMVWEKLLPILEAAE
jgi:ADP-heptose:LPS heptosyltransferase